MLSASSRSFHFDLADHPEPYFGVVPGQTETPHQPPDLGVGAFGVYVTRLFQNLGQAARQPIQFLRGGRLRLSGLGEVLLRTSS
jgi:hypothetical protein